MTDYDVIVIGSGSVGNPTAVDKAVRKMMDRFPGRWTRIG